MRKGVNFYFKLDVATASLRSVLPYEAPLINTLFALRASTTSASVSQASGVTDDPPSSTSCAAPDISEACSITQPSLGDTDLFVCHASSTKDKSVRVEWLRQSGRAPSEPSKTSRWQLTRCPPSIPCVALHIALPSQFHCFFSLSRSPILNEHCGVAGQL